MARSFRLVPPPLDATIERPRLLRDLRRRFDVAVTAVVAGAGFGKSVLLAQAIRDNAVAPRGTDLWLSCDADDALATNLLSGLAAAAEVDPARAIDANGFIVAVAQRWPMGVCVILDDLHLIAEDSAGARTVVEMVADAPAAVSFVLASRSPIAGLARLRAQTRLVELGENDLAYVADEIAQVDSQVTPDLGGWPALVTLASGFGVSAAREFVLEELVPTIDPDTRRALATLALIGGADPELAEIATGKPVDASALLRLPMVASHGTYLVPHALWNELLAHELDPADIREVHSRVGRALLDRGDEIRAGSSFLAAGDGEGLRLAVRAACVRGYATTPGDVLATWWAALGPDDRDSNEAVLLDALVRRSTEPFSDSTREALATAVAESRESGDVRLEIAASWEFGFVARARGEIDALVAEIPRVLELESQGETLASPLATIARVVVNDAMADHVAAEQQLAELDRTAVARGWLAPIEFLRMVFAFADGDLDEVAAAADAYLDCLPDDYPGRAFVDPWVRWLRGVAPTDWDTLPVPGTFPGSTAADRLWSGSCIGIMLAYADRSEQADTAVDVAVGAAETTLLPHLQAMVAGARAALCVSRGSEDQARSILWSEVGADAAGIQRRERAFRHVLSIAYVLAPELRRYWDDTELGPLHDGVRSLARALMDVRAGETPSGLGEQFALEHLATALPLGWAVELACAHAATDPIRAREMVERLVDAHGERTRTALRQAANSSSKAVAKGAAGLLSSVPVGSFAVEIGVLGPTELVVGGRAAEGPDWRRGRVRALLCLLALRRRIRREEVMVALWPDLDDNASRHNLRVTLSYLQRLLEPDRQTGEAPFYLRQDGDWLRLLDEPHVVIDAEIFEQAIDRGDRSRLEGRLELAAAEYQTAFAVWRGDALADVANEEWAQSSVARLMSRAVNARLALAAIQLALDDAASAIDEALAALETDPWCEPAHRLIVAAHLARGDRPAARRAVQQCRAMLDELGVAPSPETRVLERRLADAD